MKKSLFGYGLTTKAIAKSGGWDIYDDKFQAEEMANEKKKTPRNTRIRNYPTGGT